MDDRDKIVSMAQLGSLGEAWRAAGKRVVHCHGCFDIVHPGHVRYLRFAKAQGDVLVVTITSDALIAKGDGMRPYVPEALRAESLAALGFVDAVAVARGATAEAAIDVLRPAVYVKGREYEHSTHPGFLAEKTLVEARGGEVMFSSGEVVFSSTSIIESMASLHEDASWEAQRLAAWCAGWGLSHASVHDLLTRKMAGRRVAVVGDALLDVYVHCEAGELASEGPVVSVRPQKQEVFAGGAAVVAGHIQSLGGEAVLVCPSARDQSGEQLRAAMRELGVALHAVAPRTSLPVKERYVCERQKLLKVNRGEVQLLDRAGRRSLMHEIDELGRTCDAVIFVDFGYGFWDAPTFQEATQRAKRGGTRVAVDVSGGRETLRAGRGVDLLTPTEKELRTAMGMMENSLPVAAGRLMNETGAGQMLVTLGAKGCVCFEPPPDAPEVSPEETSAHRDERLRSGHVPALGDRVVDVVGAGDALLATAVMALAGGATLCQAGYLGSLASSLAIAAMGNRPVSREALWRCAAGRAELGRMATPADDSRTNHLRLAAG